MIRPHSAAVMVHLGHLTVVGNDAAEVQKSALAARRAVGMDDELAPSAPSLGRG